jgi:hypothetical protein
MIRAADINRDGDPDLVDSARVQPLVVWYENTRKSAAALWKKHVMHRGFHGAVEAVAADLDGDKDLEMMELSSITLLSLKRLRLVTPDNLEVRRT